MSSHSGSSMVAVMGMAVERSQKQQVRILRYPSSSRPNTSEAAHFRRGRWRAWDVLCDPRTMSLGFLPAPWSVLNVVSVPQLTAGGVLA